LTDAKQRTSSCASGPAWLLVASSPPPVCLVRLSFGGGPQPIVFATSFVGRLASPAPTHCSAGCSRLLLAQWQARAASRTPPSSILSLTTHLKDGKAPSYDWTGGAEETRELLAFCNVDVDRMGFDGGSGYLRELFENRRVWIVCKYVRIPLRFVCSFYPLLNLRGHECC
jgi:hypothetical protein